MPRTIVRPGSAGRLKGGRFNLTYNPAGLVATLADSGGRSSSYAYDASKRRTGDTGPRKKM